MKNKKLYVGAISEYGKSACIKIENIQVLEIRDGEVIATVNGREFTISNAKIGTDKKIVDHIIFLGLDVLG